MKKHFVFAVFAVFAALTHGAAHDSLWKGLEPKNKLRGPAVEPEELMDKIVVICEFDSSNLKTFPFTQFDKWIRDKKSERLFAIFTPDKKRMDAAEFSRMLADANIEDFPKSASFYQGVGIATTNLPAAKKRPAFHVVGIDGNLKYSGSDATAAKKAAGAALAKLPKEHPIFGIAEPVKLAGAVTNHFAEGRLMRPGMSWLRKMSANKDPETAKEARHLAMAIEQKRDMRLKMLYKEFMSKPAQAMWELETLLAMWPDLKNSKTVARMHMLLKKNPDREKVAKIYAACEKMAARPVAKASEAKKAAAFYKANATKLERLKNSSDTIAGAEATTYQQRVESLAGDMENWTPGD